MTERAPADDITQRITRLAERHTRLSEAVVRMDAYLDVEHFLTRPDIQAEYAARAAEARSLYQLQSMDARALRGEFDALTPDQAQVLVVVEFDLARLARSLGEEETGG